jgi:hypothetical protein
MEHLILTTCSGCACDVALDTERMVISLVKPEPWQWNIPPELVSGDLYGDADLWQWDCPNCQYADSYDPNHYTEENR